MNDEIALSYRRRRSLQLGGVRAATAGQLPR